MSASEVSRPRVSVLMPAYNAERYVGESVKSILSQRFSDFEFLIIDDGSTDGTRGILEDYAATDPRITLVSRQNRGLVASLNEMIEQAQGEFLARMDADDVAHPDRFSRQVDYLQGNPACVLVGSRVLVIDPEGEPLQVMGDALSHEQIESGLMMAKGQLIYHPTVMMLSEAVRERGGYRSETFPAEDLDLFLRLAEVGRLANLPDPLLSYREHMNKVGYHHVVRQGEAVRSVLLEAYERRGLEPPEFIRQLRFQPKEASDRHRIWAWWALGSGHVGTARKHARRVLARRPFNLSSWRLLYCTLRGR